MIDRLRFQRFVGFGFMEEDPDFTTIWRFRQRLARAGMIDRLFKELNPMLESHGKELNRTKITIANATLVDAARKAPKGGMRSSQKDYDARGIRKGKRGYYGYKGHIGDDKDTGLIHHASFTPANIRDSQGWVKSSKSSSNSAIFFIGSRKKFPKTRKKVESRFIQSFL